MKLRFVIKGLPGIAWLDNLPAMKGIARRHSREGGNKEVGTCLEDEINRGE